VPKKLFKPPENVIQEWPEVFEHIYMSTVPISYMDSVEIEFTDGRIWEINVAEQLELNKAEIVAVKLIEAFREYQDEIQNMNFKVDIEKLKKDVLDSTKGILGEK
jgi:hypothetical protein